VRRATYYAAIAIVALSASAAGCKFQDPGIDASDAPAIDPCAVVAPESARAALGDQVATPVKRQQIIMLTCTWSSPEGQLELTALPSYNELIGDENATVFSLMYDDPEAKHLDVAGVRTSVIVPHIYPSELPQDGATLAMRFEKVELTVALRSKVPDAADRLQALAGDVAAKVNAEP
jgi:hypothetical protein